MTCASLHPYTCEIEPNMLFSNYARRVDDYLEYCRYYFTAMQQLGAKVFVLHGNKVPAASVNKDMYFTRFRRLAELGESYGVQVAQENVARCTSASLPFLLEMRDALGKQARFVLDIKQAVRSGEDPFAMLRGLNSHIVHVHISDHREYGDCLPLGKGRFRFDAFSKGTGGSQSGLLCDSGTIPQRLFRCGRTCRQLHVAAKPHRGKTLRQHCTKLVRCSRKKGTVVS